VNAALSIGFTLMVTVTGDPVHPDASEVIVYTAVPGDVPVTFNTSVIDTPVPGFPPLTPVCETVQLIVVPDTLLLNAMEVIPPSQNVIEEGVAVITGVGFTVTLTVIGVPGHPEAEGVIVYTTVPAVVPVAVSVCAMADPLPDNAPEAPVCVTVHENVVPVTLLVRATPVTVPEQIVCDEGVASATGVGFTVIVMAGTVVVQPAGVVAVIL
jgi:hypothetical protein